MPEPKPTPAQAAAVQQIVQNERTRQYFEPLDAEENKFVLEARQVGLEVEQAYNLVKDIRHTHPDDYAAKFHERLRGLKEEQELKKSVAEKRKQIRALEIQLAGKRHFDEEKFLDKRIAELTKQIEGGEKS